MISVDSHGSRERFRERSTSPFEDGTQRIPPGRRDSGPASDDGGRSRSPSPNARKYQSPILKRQMRTMPVENSKFIWDIVSYISNLQVFFDFAIGCGIPCHIVQRAIEDNGPSDDNISLEDCVVQALTVWWLSSNRPAIWKSERIRQSFVELHMPGIHSCLIKRHPTMDPKPPVPTNQNGPQPGTSGQMSTRPVKYLSMEYISLYLKNTEYNFLRESYKLIKTPENAYRISCITNLPEATFVCIRQEHTCFGLSVKEIQGRIAFHVLAIWYILSKGVYHIIPLIKEMFYDLELEEECADILDKFPWMASERDAFGAKNKTNKIQMGTKVLGKGQKSKSSTTASQSNYSSIGPLNPIRENGDQQSLPLITFGLVHSNDMGATTENLGQSINVTFEVDNGNSRDTPPNPHILLRDVSQEQSQGDRLATLSDKL